MGASESWVYLKDGVLMLHVENDGPRFLRHGPEAPPLITKCDYFASLPTALPEPMQHSQFCPICSTNRWCRSAKHSNINGLCRMRAPLCRAGEGTGQIGAQPIGTDRGWAKPENGRTLAVARPNKGGVGAGGGKIRRSAVTRRAPSFSRFLLENCLVQCNMDRGRPYWRYSWMVCRDRVEDYLARAALCDLRAEEARDPTARATFAAAARCWREMAQCWRDLEEAPGFGRLQTRSSA